MFVWRWLYTSCLVKPSRRDVGTPTFAFTSSQTCFTPTHSACDCPKPGAGNLLLSAISVFRFCRFVVNQAASFLFGLSIVSHFVMSEFSKLTIRYVSSSLSIGVRWPLKSWIHVIWTRCMCFILLSSYFLKEKKTSLHHETQCSSWRSGSKDKIIEFSLD